MARETLPSGASLLALAGSTAIRPTEPEPAKAPTAPTPTPTPQSSRSLARRRILAKPVRNAVQPEEPTPEPVLQGERRQKINARIPAVLAEAVRDCVVHLSGPPHGMTMDAFAEEAYRRELERLKRAHHDGEPFPTRPYNPKPGRRVA